MGVWSSDQGNYATALSYFEESLALRREVGDKRGVAISLGNLGVTALRQGNYPTAQSWGQQSLEQYQELGDKRGTATSLNELGRVALQLGEHEKAFSLFKESLAIFEEIDNIDGSLIFLEGMAELAFYVHKYERAARLLSAVKVARDRACLPLPPVDKIAQGNILSSLQSALGESQFSALWAEGKTLTMEQVIRYALHNE
jgi:tetratricopeptide (TPR) repeat protein